MKKFFTSLAALALMACTATAAQWVVVTDAQGAQTSLALDQTPTVTFTDQYLVATAGEQELQLPITDQATFTIADQPAGLGQINADALAISIFGNQLTVSGLAPKQTVEVFTADGRRVVAKSAAHDGTAAISLEAVNGIAIVRAANRVVKIKK